MDNWARNAANAAIESIAKASNIDPELLESVRDHLQSEIEKDMQRFGVDSWENAQECYRDSNYSETGDSWLDCYKKVGGLYELT